MSAADMETKMDNDRDANGPKDQSPQNHPGGRGGGGRGGMGGGRGSRFNRPRDDMRNIRQQDEHGIMDGDIHGDGGEGMGSGNVGGMAGRGRGRGNRYWGGRDDIRGGGVGAGLRSQEDRLNERLAALAGPTLDLPPQDVREKKFSGRCRLYVGNLTNDVTEEEINTMFTPYGETSEVFVNKDKNFAFIRLDYRASAEKAKRELDGSIRKGRALKVRFAPHSAAVKIRNLTQWVTNELLERAFQVFGEIERAVVIVDERGKSTGEGIIEFARKPGAQMALRKCTDGCFFLTSSLRPVVLEPFEQVDEVDGYTERNLPKKNPDYMKSREVGPRFAAPGSFEYEYGTRWKQLFELRKQKEDALNRELKMEEEKLEAQMEYARYEHETEMLREQLRMREQDRERQKREWELKERQHEEQRRQDEDMMRRQQEDMDIRMRHQEEELRRRQQENSLFMQAHQLNSLLDQQEQALRQAPGGGGGYDSPLPAEASIREYDAAIGGPVGGPGSLPPALTCHHESYPVEHYMCTIGFHHLLNSFVVLEYLKLQKALLLSFDCILLLLMVCRLTIPCPAGEKSVVAQLVFMKVLKHFRLNEKMSWLLECNAVRSTCDGICRVVFGDLLHHRSEYPSTFGSTRTKIFVVI
ncbi:hrp65 protein-like isoform X3 [Ischnura elegans]|uniref:hrp65 protein-like isoform X3 n=1 Tax=Ischnura elegans TaxID=197161 RepID=UPI001ED86FBA|nr:hrp65 protein-like isoform X3 [Ischnura elegans]